MVIRALFVVALTGCLSVPDHAGTHFACDKDPRCPDGFACVGGTCVAGLDKITSPDFTMGCDPGMDNCGSDAQPAHKVTLQDFVIDHSEVSVGAYQECIDAGMCTDIAVKMCGTCGPDTPIRFVSWNDAVAFCTFRHLKLPTEAQWERAARTANQPFPWGSMPTPADCDHAVTNTCGDPRAVDANPAGDAPGGIHDMLGNVREWIDDEYDPGWYTDPRSKVDPDNKTAGTNKRVVRGGGFHTPGATLTVWTRDSEDDPINTRKDDLGFRCAL